MRSQKTKQLGRWFVLSLLLALVTGTLYTMVSLPPAIGQSTNVTSDLLVKQLEFMLKMNSAFLGFLGTVGVLLTWFFKNNLDDAKEVAADLVERELKGQVKALVQQEFDIWERTVLPERIVSNTPVNYFVPNSAIRQSEINEIKLLEIRGFQKPIQFSTKEEKIGSRAGDVTVLDLQNMVMPSGVQFVQLTPDEQKTQSEQLITRLFKHALSESAVLVIYFRGRINGLNAIDPTHKTQYLLIANNPVTLLGHVANGAYVASGDRNSSIVAS